MNTKDNKLLGALFQYYRTMKKLSRKDVSLLGKNNYLSLSESTIKRIEIKNINNNDSTLKKYAQILSLKYEKDIFPYNKLNTYVEKTLYFINISATNEIEIVYEELLGFHNLYRQYIYLSEVSRMLISVLEDIALDKRICASEQRIYEFVTKVIDKDSKLITLAYYLLYKSYLFDKGNTGQNMFKIKKIISKVNFKNIFNVDQIRFDIYDSNPLTLYNKYKRVYTKCNKDNDNNIATKVTSIFNLAYCEAMLKDYVSAEKHFKEILELNSSNNRISNYIVYNVYNNLGFVYFNLSKFHQAIECFNISRKQKNNSIGYNFLLLFISLEATNQINYAITIIKEELENVKLPVIKNILEYHKMKYSNEDDKKLEEFIIKHLNKKEVPFEFYSDLIYKELYNLVTKTKHYKCLYLYLEKN